MKLFKSDHCWRKFCVPGVFLLWMAGATAGQSEIQASEYIATVISMNEKCTGDVMSAARMDRLVKSMLKTGVTPKEFEIGANRAKESMLRRFPGDARPSRDACDAAASIYNQFK